MTGLKKILLVTGLLTAFVLKSQNRVEGRVVDEKQQPVAFCALGLLNVKDSTVFKSITAGEEGDYYFENIPSGEYIVKASSAGYSDAFLPLTIFDSINKVSTEPLILKGSGLNLDEVSVTAIKKLVEFKNGNVTVNIEGSPISEGKTVYDLLSQLPGVMVDGDNISLNGKPGVRFLIDDKLQQLSGPQLTSLLKSINASSVSKIEIIKNPPVKYDASGTGGLINIVTKKVKLTGFSGNAFMSYSQGFYSNNFAQLALNYKGNKFNLFSNFNATYSDYRGVNVWNRYVTDAAGFTTTLTQKYIEKNTTQFASYFMGGDWYISKRSTLSFRADGRPGKELIDRNATTAISDNSLGYQNLAFNFQKPNSWYMQDYSLNFEQAFDTNGTKLNINAAYSDYPNIYKADYQNHYYDASFIDNQPVKLFRSVNDFRVSVSALKADFEMNLGKTWKLEAGAKGSVQRLNSDFVFENLDPGTNTYIRDSSFTNSFYYREEIMAGYLNIRKEFKKMSFQAGLRGENTQVNANSETNDVTYTRSYFNLFPVASLDYNRSDNHHFQLTYNRRINRADYNSFNPFKSFRSILTATQGNPYLVPQYTHNMEVTYSYKGNISNSLGYSLTDNFFLTYNRQNNETKELIFYITNLKHSHTFSYNFYMQKEIRKWWNININFSSYYFFYSGNIEGVSYSASAFCNNGGIFNQILLSKNLKLEIGGWCAGPWLEGVNYNKTRGSLNVGVRYTTMKDKLTISVGAWDILYTQKSRNYMNYADMHSDAVHKWDSRRVYLMLNINFGKIKVQQKNTKTDSEEKNRFKRS